MKKNLCNYKVVFDLFGQNRNYKCLIAGQMIVTPEYLNSKFTCSFSQACKTIKTMSNFSVSLNFIAGEGNPFEVELANTMIKVVDEITLTSNQEKPRILTL
jgi:hypothetical protein